MPVSSCRRRDTAHGCAAPRWKLPGCNEAQTAALKPGPGVGQKSCFDPTAVTAVGLWYWWWSAALCCFSNMAEEEVFLPNETVAVTTMVTTVVTATLRARRVLRRRHRRRCLVAASGVHEPHQRRMLRKCLEHRFLRMGWRYESIHYLAFIHADCFGLRRFSVVCGGAHDVFLRLVADDAEFRK